MQEAPGEALARALQTIDDLFHPRQVGAWALRHGRPLSSAALEVIVAAKQARREPFRRWTEQSVRELLWHGVVAWCRDQEVDVPERVAETLWTYLSYLDEERQLEAGSDPVARLRAPLMADADLTRDGRERVLARRRHPSERTRTARPSARLAPVVPLRRTARG